MRVIGLAHAVRGVAAAVRGGRNLRVHITAAFYVSAYATIARMGRLEWAALCLCFGLVISLEIVNTALERLCDRVTREREPAIGAVKDMAAGGVLAASLATVGVAAALFCRWDVFCAVRDNCLSYIVLITLPLWAWFIKGKRTWR